MLLNEQKVSPIKLLLTIFAISINLRPAITSIGPMLEIIRDDLFLSNTQVSLLTALPVLCMGIFASLSPILKRKFGLQNTMYFMLLVIGVGTLSRGMFSNYLVLLFSALFIGIAIAVIGPLLSAMIKEYFPHRATSVIGLYSFGMGVGSAASAGLTGVFYELSHSYRFALGIWALLILIGLVLWNITIKEVNKEKNPKDRLRVVGKTTSPWKVRRAWIFLLFFGLQSAFFFSIITWFVPVALSNGYSLLKAGAMLTLATTIQIFLNLLLPLAMERFLSRRFWIFFMLLTGLASIVLLWTGNEALMWISAFLMGIPLGGLFPVALLLPLDETSTADETNDWTSMMQTGGFIIGGTLPLVIAFIYDQTNNHHITLTMIGLLFVGMAILTFFLKGEE